MFYLFFSSGHEHLPVDGPAILLFYHGALLVCRYDDISKKETEGPYIVRGTPGALPVDYYFLVADTLLNRGRWEILIQS